MTLSPPSAAPSAADIRSARAHGLGDLLRRTALRVPDKLGLVSGDVRWTFRELDETVNRVANALAERGVATGDRVALLSHNGWQFAVVAYATAKLGAVLVPVNFMLKAHEVAFILEHSGAAGMIVEDALQPVAEEAMAVADMPAGVRGWIALGGQPAPDGWEDVETWARHADAAAPAVGGGGGHPPRLGYKNGRAAGRGRVWISV